MNASLRLIRGLGHLPGAVGAAEVIGRPTAAGISFASSNVVGEPEEGTLLACALCDDVKVDGVWIPEDDAVRALRTFEDAAQPDFALTLCDDCAERIGARRIRRYRS